MKPDEAPVVPGRLYGLRAWTVDSGKRLGSLSAEGVWATGSTPTKARCAAGRRHPAPAHDCGCGLYALHPTVAECQSSFSRMQRAARGGRLGDVSGIVAAWGEVELHKSGFRAEYAQTYALLLPSGAEAGYARQVRVLAARHGAEVWEIASGHDLHRRCVEKNLGLSQRAVKELLGPEVRRKARRDRLGRWWETATDLAVGAAALVMTGLIPGFFVISILVALLSGDADEPRPPAPPPGPKLQILDQRLIDADGDDFYVALVRNPSRTKSALQVYATGAFLDRSGNPIQWPDRPRNTDNRPSLAPGQVGVLWDWVAGYGVADRVKRSRVRVVADRWTDHPRRSPIGVSRLRVERPECLVTATVRSAWRRIDAEFAFIVRRRGQIIAAGTWVAGPLPRGRSRRILERIEPRPCLRGRFELAAYPNLSAEELRERDQPGPPRGQ